MVGNQKSNTSSGSGKYGVVALFLSLWPSEAKNPGCYIQNK